MARTTLIVDTDAIKDHVSALIKDGFGKVLEHITAILATHKHDAKNLELDVSGMREQIVANIHVLLPIIGSKHGMSFWKGNRFAVVPDIHVITVGQEPNVKAYVLQGNVTCCERFVDADKGATTAEALKKLLVLTQQMLDFHIDSIGACASNAACGNVNNGDAEGWDSNAMTNPAASFSFDRRESSIGSDASSDSALGCRDSDVFVVPSLEGFSDTTTLCDFADDYSYYTY